LKHEGKVEERAVEQRTIIVGEADAHLRACPDCRNWFEALAEIGAALGASFEDIHAPATLATHVRRQIVDHQPARVSPVPEILDFVGWLGVIGAAGLLAYFLIPAGYTLTCCACPGFVEFVENGDVDSEQVHILAERLLAPVRDAKVDTLVLCTGHTAVDELADALDDLAMDVRVIGDAASPRTAEEAGFEGLKAAAEI